MSYWSHNPELLDEIIAKNLPEPYYTQYAEGEIDICDVPEDIRCKAMDGGIADYWGERTDEAKMRYKNDVVQMGKEAADRRWGICKDCSKKLGEAKDAKNKI